MATDEKRDTFTSLLISSASKENLELMIHKITELKKKELALKKPNPPSLPKTQ